MTELLSLAPTQEVQWEEMCADSLDQPGESRNLVMDCRRLRGPVDRELLTAAARAVMRRHDALRLVFDAVGLRPAARVRDDIDVPLEWHDVRDQDVEVRTAAGEQLLAAASTLPFAATAEPMWRMTVAQVADDEVLVSAQFSHVVADGHSCDVFFRDLVAHCTGAADALPPALSMAELLARQQERYGATPERLGFWRERIGPHLAEPGLLPDLRPPHADAQRRHHLFFPLRPDVVEGVRRTAWLARTTPFLALLTAYQLTLGLVSGKRATIVVTSASGRRDVRERATIFQMATYPYVVLEPTDDQTLVDLVRSVHASFKQSSEHLVGYTELAAAANPGFEAVRPWPDVNLVDGTFHSWPAGGDDVVAGDLVMTQLPNPVLAGSESPGGERRPVPRSGDLTPELAGCRPGLTVSLERDRCVLFFNDQLYSEESMQRFADDFAWVASRLASKPHAAVREVARDLTYRRPDRRPEGDRPRTGGQKISAFREEQRDGQRRAGQGV